ncbi:unnamed protein product [Symbiodinium sp. CCMP2592]|nr:unnamed protein product [Symbiodinium sp. CCMP2592]
MNGTTALLRTYGSRVLQLPVVQQLAESALLKSAAEELAQEARAAPAAVFVALTLLLLFLFRGSSASSAKPAVKRGKNEKEVVDYHDSAVTSFLDRLGVPQERHLEACFVPCGGFMVNGQISEFENDVCYGKMLEMHRATHDKELDKSADYPYGSYFVGKKRLWETRVQLKFKKPPIQSEMFFGIELEKYVPMSRSVKRTMDGVVRMLKGVVGNQIYHSVGDNPEECADSAELEMPTFVMPMWAFDQYIVTAEGEVPPELDDECIPELGSKRSGRVSEFRKELDNIVFEVGPTYTLCFWGISQWLDKLNWQLKLPLLGRLHMDQFAGSPPVHVVIYTLNRSQDPDDKRHLNSRKQYYLNVAFWSSNNRPRGERVMELLGAATQALDPSRFSPRMGGLSPVKRRADSGVASSWLACCAGH